MGHLLRPALYDAYHEIYNLSNPDGQPHTYDIVGNICESADFFGRGRSVQQIREGDILAIMDTGALQYTLDQAQTESNAAKQKLAGLADSQYKQALIFLADYAVERHY